MNVDERLIGRVLLIAVDGALQPSRVVGVSTGKLEHINLPGVRGHVAPKRALWISEHRCDSEASLAAYWERVCAAADAIDLAALWRAATHAEITTPQKPAAIFEGAGIPADTCEEDALVCAVFAERLHFRFRAGLISVSSPKALREALIARQAREKRARHRVIAARLLAARREGHGGEPGNSDESEAIDHHISALEDLAVNAKAAEHYRASLSLMRELGVDVTVPVIAAAKLLVELGVWTRHENVALRRSGLSAGHSTELLEQACELASQPPDLKGRTDYRSLLTIAIDDVHTDEVDDAFAVDGSRIVVFIADAAAWLPRNGPVFTDAAMRASTMYLPEGRFPMLPASLGQRHASLMAGEDRLALAYSFSLDADGKPHDFKVERAYMSVDRRLTYDEVDNVLEGTGTELDAGIIDLIYTGAQLMDEHAAWRAASGAISFTRDEVNLVADPQTGRVEIHPSAPNGPARQLVAEMMVAVCGGAAAYCLRHKIPTIYRSQPPPDDPIELPDQPILGAWEQWNILRRFKPSKISVRPATHYSLGLPVYTQVSSPLRRLQDLLMNHQLSAFVAGQKPPFDEADLRTHIAQIEIRTGEIRNIEHLSRRYWSLWYLETYPDKTLEGLVVHEAGRRWVIRVPELALVLSMQPRRRLRRSQRIKLKVVEVDARRDRLVLVDV